MSSVIVSLKAIIDLRKQLRDVIGDLEETLKRSDAAVEVVSQSWKDENFRNFREKFEEDKDNLTPLISDIDEYEADILYRYQEKIEIYLGNK